MASDASVTDAVNMGEGGSPHGLLESADRLARAGLYVCAGLIVIALGVALAAPASAGIAGLILFVGLAAVAASGLFWLLQPNRSGVLTEVQRIADNFSQSALEAIETPMAAVSATGEVRFSNKAYRDFISRFGIGRIVSATESPRLAFANHPLIAPAMFRIGRARLGEAKRETIYLSPGPGEAPRRLVVEEKSFAPEGEEALSLWSFRDEGPIPTEPKAPITEESLAWVEALGLPRLTIFNDGRVAAWNGLLADLAGGQMPVGRPAGDLLLDLNLERLMRPAGDGHRWSEAQPAQLVTASGLLLPVMVIAYHAVQARAVHLILSAYAPSAVSTLIALQERQQQAPPPPTEPTLQGSPLALFPRLFGDAPLGSAMIGGDGRLVASNPAFARLVGQPLEAGLSLRQLVTADYGDAIHRLIEQANAGRAPTAGIEVVLAGADKRSARVYAARLGRGGGVLLFFIDATEQKLLEEQVTQSQKMQAVGQLAGGIAHDFNNLLTAITGYCDLLLQSHPVGDPSFSDISLIRQTAARAANLVRHLLAFSRQQTLRPSVLRINDMLAETKVFLSRVITERIKLDVFLGRDLWPVFADKTQLERVIMNLAVNARDAMPEGGTLTIRTSNLPADKLTQAAPADLAHGDYVLIEVQDTGIGIAKENLSKIFDPFFTTKGVGEGTGLGLSTVYGIVTQSGGQVIADSEVGKGTIFRIYLPRDLRAEERISAEREESDLGQRMQDLTGKGTILLVEDEDAVRTFAVRALKGRGYHVLEAENAEAALEIVRARTMPVDLLLSDVVMPGMDGPTLARELRAGWPQLKVILISGYAEDAIRKSLETEPGIEFLPKPFSLKELAAKVKDTLGADARNAGY